MDEIVFKWNEEKNDQLKADRGLSFELVVEAIGSGHLLSDEKHPNEEDYPHQRMFVVEIDGYACVVPYVFDEKVIFLKTIFHSRKYQKKFLD